MLRFRAVFFIGIVLATLALISIITSLILLSLPRKEAINCKKFVDRIATANCGLVSTSTDGVSHAIIGIVDKIKPGNSQQIFTLKTKNTKGEVIFEDVALAPDPLETTVTALTPQKDLQKKSEVDVSISGKSIEVIKKLQEGQEILTYVRTPDINELILIKQKISSQNYVKCFSYHEQFIKYMKNPTHLSYFSLKLSKIMTGCNITVLQYSTYK